MPVVGGQELGVVLNGGQVDVTLLRAHQEQVQLVRLERESTGTVQQFDPSVQLDVPQGPVEVDAELVAVPEGVLHNGPVGHPAIAGAAVEVLVAVEVVRGPVDLPDRLAVLSIARSRHVTWLAYRAALSTGMNKNGWAIISSSKLILSSRCQPAQIVDSNVAVIKAGDNEVGIILADVEGEHPAVRQAGVLRVGRVLQAEK